MLNLLNPNVHASPITDADRRAIRALWIDDRRESYSIDFLADLLQDSSERIRNDVGDLNAAGDVNRDDAQVLALQRYSAAQIENALGPDAELVLPDGRRTRLVTFRLSSWVVEAFGLWAMESGQRWHNRDRCIDALIDSELENCVADRDVPPLEVGAGGRTAVDNLVELQRP